MLMKTIIWTITKLINIITIVGDFQEKCSP